MLQLLLQVDHEIDGGYLGQVEHGVIMQHLVIEAQMIESHDQIGALQFDQ
jgi:hypothetical protein